MEPTPAPHAEFHTTRWTLVLAAGGEDDAAAREALSALCRTYWYPLYAFARRKGAAPDAAEDLVQGFLARLIDKRELRQVARDKGRFRSFLMAALQHHVANERDRERAEKRGGGAVKLAVDFEAADERFAREPARGRTPEQEFDRAWALEVLRAALGELEREYRASSREALFDALRGELEGAPAPHAEVAERLTMSVGAVKTAAHRLRERFGETLRSIVASTVSSPAAVEAELGALLRALSQP
ncbi:MAG: sigma-70 family RNA polymerase sigma factor [Planctomycetes bacterium]|nr:sigma-70 family RNA polymerase sigma factor [Planctomycetota bacterium]